jgi:hypothetical protein
VVGGLFRKEQTVSSVANGEAEVKDLVRKPAESSGLVVFGDEWKALREQASALVKSGFLPRAVNTAEKVLTIFLTGRELGIGPMQAVRSINVIDGRPSCSAELMLALAYKRIPGFQCQVESTDKSCTATSQRPGGKPIVTTFNLDDAKRAGVDGKDNWRKYPAAMLRARAISANLRVSAPDAILGMYTPDEMEIEETEKQVTVAVVAPEVKPDDPIGPKDRARVFAAAATRGKDFETTKAEQEKMVREILGRFGYSKTEEIPVKNLPGIILAIEQWEPRETGAEG